MKNYKIIGLSALFFLIIILAAACAKGGGDDASQKNPAEQGQDQSNQSETTSPASNKEPVELVFYSIAPSDDETFNLNYGDKIRKKFPDYKLTHLTASNLSLADMVATKQEIDIYYHSYSYVVPVLGEVDLLYDMTDLIKKHNIDLNRFEPALIEGIKATGSGKIYMLPAYNQRQLMFYNKGIFDKLGVDYPENGMTWDEAYDLNAKLTRTEDGVDYIGLSVSIGHIFRENQLGISYVDQDTQKPNFMKPEWKMLFETYVLNYARHENFKKQMEHYGTFPYRNALTSDQVLAMFVFNNQLPFDAKEEMKKIDWDMVSMPVFKDKPTIGSGSTPNTLAITKTSKFKDEALNVIDYIASDEAQTVYSKRGQMPVVRSAAVKQAYATDTEYTDKNWSAVFYSDFAPLVYRSVYDPFAVDQIFYALRDVVLNGNDLNTSIQQLNEAVENYIKEQTSR